MWSLWGALLLPRTDVLCVSRVHLVCLLSLLPLPSSLAPGAPSQPPVSTASVHSSWNRDSTLRGDSFILYTFQVLLDCYIGWDVSEKSNSCPASRETRGKKPGEFPSFILLFPSCWIQISTFWLSRAAATLSVMSVFTVNLWEILSCSDKVGMWVWFDLSEPLFVWHKKESLTGFSFFCYRPQKGCIVWDGYCQRRNVSSFCLLPRGCYTVEQCGKTIRRFLWFLFSVLRVDWGLESRTGRIENTPWRVRPRAALWSMCTGVTHCQCFHNIPQTKRCQ